MDINFKCTHCGQELSADESGAGSEIQCPACNGMLVIPAPTPAVAGLPGGNLNPIASSAAAREHKHFSMPQRGMRPYMTLRRHESIETRVTVDGERHFHARAVADHRH